MISVFAAFMLSPETVAKSMGFALAAAVLFDAFIVRMVVIPAVMALLGDNAWYLPRWIDRMLPNVDIEGEGIKDMATAPHPDVPADSSVPQLVSMADGRHRVLVASGTGGRHRR
jgi:RND superfamily putative drug exporter